LDQAFILPLPQSARVPEFDEATAGMHKSIEFRSLALALEKLKLKKLSWEQFSKTFDLLTPLLRLVTTREGENILHLAVLADVEFLPQELVLDRSLLIRRNVYGQNPLEVSQFLRKGRSLFPRWLKENTLFHQQPGILADECEPLNLLFLSSPIFENTQIFSQILASSFKAKKKDQIPPEKTWMGIYFDKEIQSGMHPQVSIRFIDDEVGFGVFAAQRIPSCSYVGEYTGMIQERKKKHLVDKRYCVRYTVWEMGRRNFVIDAEKMGNFTRFINHSVNPNLSLQSVYWRGMPRMIFIALKEIEEGTQFTFDYGTFFWETCQKTPKLF